MKARQHARKPAQDTSVTSTANLQTRPFKSSNTVDQQGQNLQSSQETTEGFDLTKPQATGDRLAVQTKMSLGQPNDKYEQEANRVASDVVQHINQAPEGDSVQQETFAQQETTAQRQAESDDSSAMTPKVQLRGTGAAAEVSPELESTINQERGKGQSLDPSLQRSMGDAMGANFSGVKIHTNSQSDQLNRSLQSEAFTTGQDIFFKQGSYSPDSNSGQELIAHELTHVVQQNASVSNSVNTKSLVQARDRSEAITEAPDYVKTPA